MSKKLELDSLDRPAVAVDPMHIIATLPAGVATQVVTEPAALPSLPKPQRAPKLRRLAVDVPEDLWLAIKRAAVDRNTTIRDDVAHVLGEVYLKGKKR